MESKKGTTQLPDYKDDTKADWTAVTKPITMDDKAELASGGFQDHRVKFYDDHADAFEEDMIVHQYEGYRYVALTVHKYLKGNEDAEILDVGGGTGLVEQEMQKLGRYKNVTAVDPSAEMVKLGMERGYYKKVFTQYFNQDSGLSYDTYDAVICCSAFAPGHMKADSVVEMSRVLKKGGFMCLGLRESFMETDPDLSTLRPQLQQLVDEGVCERWEDSVYPHWFSNLPGCILVYKKL